MLLRTGIDTMNRVAGATGGRAVYVTNDIAGAIEDSVRDSEITYRLGFYPASSALDGKDHDIKVQVARDGRDGVEVRYRKAYLAADSKGPSATARLALLRSAMESPLDATEIGLTGAASGAGDSSHHRHSSATIIGRADGSSDHWNVLPESAQAPGGREGFEADVHRCSAGGGVARWLPHPPASGRTRSPGQVAPRRAGPFDWNNGLGHDRHSMNRLSQAEVYSEPFANSENCEILTTFPSGKVARTSRLPPSART